MTTKAESGTLATRAGSWLVSSVAASRRSRWVPSALAGIWFMVVAWLLRTRAFRGFDPPIVSEDGVVLAGGLRASNMNTMLLLRGVYEPALTELVRATVRPGDVCVDLGANVGWFAIAMARATGPTGTVFAIEAAPGNVECLRGNVTANGLDDIVEVVGAAVAEAPGQVAFHVHKTNDLLCRLELPTKQDPEYWWLHHWMKPSMWRRVVVPADSLPCLVQGRAAEVTMLKIDVEGLEATVCRDLLDHFTHPELTVAVEITVRSIPAVAAVFEAAGFRAFDLRNDYAWVSGAAPVEPPVELTYDDLRAKKHQVDVVFTRARVPVASRQGS